jgi:hypothetical protein
LEKQSLLLAIGKAELRDALEELVVDYGGDPLTVAEEDETVNSNG